MIPPSPILLIAAAQAMSRDARVTAAALCPVEGEEAASGMSFIHHAGFWSHYDAQVGASSWPLDPRWSLHDVMEVAGRLELLQLNGSAGDLLVSCSEDGRPARIGVVLATGERMQLPGEAPTWECDALWGGHTGLSGRTSLGSQGGSWFRGGRGDRYLPWYLMPHYRSLTLRRRVA